jgi:hypothetical protein
VIELLTTFGRLNRGDRVRLSCERDVRKVVAAVDVDDGLPGAATHVSVSFGGPPLVMLKKEFVWLVLSPG